MTSLWGLRAARPIFWISDVVDLKNPSLSASNIAINDTSGKSIPSLRRFIPTSISASPERSFLIISRRSNVDISLCKYSVLYHLEIRKFDISSEDFFVSVRTSILPHLEMCSFIFSNKWSMKTGPLWGFDHHR